MLETLKFGKGNWANKTDSTLAYSDQYGNFQAIPFDFTRATTATRVNKQGLIESVNDGIARIDYSDSTQGALLLEPERTNLIINSEDFSASSWTKTGTASVTNNTTISPDGTQNADTLNLLSGNFFYQPVVGVGTFTMSCYVKVPSGTLDFKMQTFSSTDGAIQSPLFVATTEWQRFEHTVTVTVNSSFYPIQVSSLVGGDFEIYGGQVEQSSYATSYIPTNGATATRNGEFASNSNILSSMGQTEGTIFIDVISAEKDTEILSFNRSSQNAFFLYTNASNNYRVSSYLDGTVRANTLISGNQRIKIAIAYEDNNQRLYVNGVLIQTYTDSWTPNQSMYRIFFNQGGYVAAKGKSNISALQVFKTSLTDAQLQTLTTI